MNRTAPIARALSLLCTLAAGTSAATLPPADADVREEIRFARGLATEWQFVELAEEVLEGIDTGDVGEELAEELDLVRCEVYASAARRERDRERQGELFDKAIEAYAEFVDEHPFSERKEAAELALVDVSSLYGQVLRRAYDEAVGEDAEAVAERLDDVLSAAVSMSEDLTESLASEIESLELDEQSTEALERERWRLMHNRGRMLLYLAEVLDQFTLYDLAAKTLEELALDAGENKRAGLEAYILLGEVYAAQGLYGDTQIFLEYVVDRAMPRDPDERQEQFSDLTQGQLDARWTLVEKAVGGLVDAYMQDGEPETAIEWSLFFYNAYQSYGFTLSHAYGYPSLLSVARSLLAAGGWIGGSPGSYRWFQTRDDMESAGIRGKRNQRSATDLALALAETVNRDNRGNILQVRAQRVISEVIERGVEVDPEVLFEAAQGEYYEQDFPAAIESFKRVLARLEAEDEATRTRFGPKVFYHIGRSFQRQDRHLEASMAFQTGLDRRWAGDPQYDRDNAKQLLASLQQVQRESGRDPLIEGLVRSAQDIYVDVNQEDAGEIRYAQAKRLYDSGDYEAARTAFGEVTGDADSYEKALVYSAVCLQKVGDLDGAQRELRSYLDDFVNDPINQTTSQAKLARRDEAMALATYYGGLIAFTKAAKGSGGWSEVREWLGDYHVEFTNQRQFAPRAMYMTLLAHLNESSLDAADAVLEDMREIFPEDESTGRAAFKVYSTLKDLREEAAEAGDAEAERTYLERMAENMHLSNTLADSPSFDNLRLESTLWFDLKEWEKAKEILTTLEDRFGESSDADVQEKMEAYVLPDLAHTLLALREVDRAAEILTEIVPDGKPSSRTALDYCRALTGWVEGDADEIVEVVGIGGQENFEAANELYIQLSRSVEKWTCEWYQIKFDLAYAYYAWGKLDSSKRESARRQVQQMKSDLSDDLTDIATQCGDEVLRKRYLWLWSKL